MDGMDHSNMDHSNMDHSSMGMEGNGSTTTASGGHHMMMMNMFFTTDWKGSYLLFKSWQLNEVWQLAVACVVLGIVAALYEGLKVLREALLVRFGRSQTSGRYSTSDKGSGGEVRTRMCTCTHLLQTILHIVQVTVSYFLMLAVMTFNVYLGISVVVGAGLGYFLFGWKRAIVNDVNEHCH